MKKNKIILLLFEVILLLHGCGTREFLGFEKKKIRLEGERVSILKASDEQKKSKVNTLNTKLTNTLSIPDWNQGYNSPTHLSPNFYTNSKFSKFKRLVSGAGEKSDRKILSQPVSDNQFIFFLDAKGNIISFDLFEKKVIWKYNIAPTKERDHYLGGGIGIYKNKIIATTPYGDIISLDIKNGQEIWRRSFDIPFRSSPTIFDGKVLAITISNRLYVIEAETGDLLWQHEGLMNNTTLISTSKVAVDENIAIVPYSSGEFFGLNITNGKQIWKNSFINYEKQETSNSFKDIDAYPVINKDIVILSSAIGKMIAINKKNGNRFWDADVSSSQTPAVNGNSIFVVNNNKEILCLDLINGGIRWSIELKSDFSKNQKYIWQTPVIMNNKIVLVGGNKKMLIIDSVEGKLEKIKNLPNFPSSSPFSVNEIVYLMFKNGDITQID